MLLTFMADVRLLIIIIICCWIERTLKLINEVSESRRLTYAHSLLSTFNAIDSQRSEKQKKKALSVEKSLIRRGKTRLQRTFAHRHGAESNLEANRENNCFDKLLLLFVAYDFHYSNVSGCKRRLPSDFKLRNRFGEALDCDGSSFSIQIKTSSTSRPLSSEGKAS